MSSSSFKQLHKGRGTWIYQSPRILLLLLYGVEKGLPLKELFETHLSAARRLGVQFSWFLERIKNLGYETRGGAEPDLEAATRYAERLRINKKAVVDVLDEILKALGSAPEQAAYLPPILTLPEKRIVLEGLAASEYFELRKWITWLASPRKNADATYIRERRFRAAWLYALHMVAPDWRPTCLGYAVAVQVEAGVDAWTAYLSHLARTDNLKWLVALEAAFLRVGTKDQLDRLLAAYRKFVEVGDEVYTAFIYQPSDVKGVKGMALPAKHPKEIVETLERC